MARSTATSTLSALPPVATLAAVAAATTPPSPPPSAGIKPSPPRFPIDSRLDSAAPMLPSEPSAGCRGQTQPRDAAGGGGGEGGRRGAKGSESVAVVNGDTTALATRRSVAPSLLQAASAASAASLASGAGSDSNSARPPPALMSRLMAVPGERSVCATGR
nr:hypothetical protein L203_04030 [Cryptococcus depauperatus CBS 7841]